jgi:hypothetical protein
MADTTVPDPSPEPHPSPEPEDAGQQWWARRWRGQPGRLEVWYATLTDAATGAGLWVHGETVAPTQQQGGPVTSHGWAAWFPADEPPVWGRTGSTEGDPGAGPDGTPERTFRCEGLALGPHGSTGTAGIVGAGEGDSGETGELRWDLRWDSSAQQGLATFPRWAWDREALPAAQVVPAPSMEATGWVEHGGRRHEVSGHAQVARIFGHGSAERWAWLHADLGDGDVVELVTAVSRRPALRNLPPLSFLKVRVGGQDWPSARLACWGLRTRLDLPTWTVRGRTHGVEVDIEVVQPPQRCVSIDYVDPDGDTATCTNTERADLRLRLRTPSGVEREWVLEGTAHAEVGRRP